jgi:hypothetical protein
MEAQDIDESIKGDHENIRQAMLLKCIYRKKRSNEKEDT